MLNDANMMPILILCVTVCDTTVVFYYIFNESQKVDSNNWYIKPKQVPHRKMPILELSTNLKKNCRCNGPRCNTDAAWPRVQT